MGILLAFAPFIVFAIFDRVLGAGPGLIAGAAVSALLLGRSWVAGHRIPKVLELGTLLLFGGLAIYALLGGPTGSIFGVRLCVDIGLLMIVLVSLALRRPFTLQYARETVAPALWDSPAFIRANYVITAAWALALAVLVVVDLVLVYEPTVPMRAGMIATVLVVVGAAKFTSWYPQRGEASARSAANA